MKLLVEKGADVSAVNEKGENLWLWVTSTHSTPPDKCMMEVIALLLNHGVDVNRSDTPLRVTALYRFSLGAPTPYLKLLLEGGADINAKTIAGATPLMAAIMQGKTEIAEFLIEKGADVTAKSQNGLTALKVALSQVEKGNTAMTKIVDRLKARGAKE